MPRASLLVLHASQTGTAQELAERCTGRLVRRDFDVQCSSFAEFDVTTLPLQVGQST